jgi:hypothetical protein
MCEVVAKISHEQMIRISSFGDDFHIITIIYETLSSTQQISHMKQIWKANKY